MTNDNEDVAVSMLFDKLEAIPENNSEQPGIRQQRIHTNSLCDLYLAVQKPSMSRELVVRFREQALPREYELPEFDNLLVRKETEKRNNTLWCKIVIRPLQLAFNEIFTSLATDLAKSISAPTDDRISAQLFLSRLYQWQHLLRKGKGTALTPEEQQGLFGELWFLQYLLEANISPSVAVIAWTGSESTDRDFQFSNAIGVEVKTTRSSGHKTLTISNERQLDDTGMTSLFLLHIAVERIKGGSHTLPHIVSALRDLLSFDATTTDKFEDSLVLAGYLDIHAKIYADTSYAVHSYCPYLVQPGFPRIVPRDLPIGIGNVRYTIDSSACLNFSIDLSRVIDELGGHS